MPDSPDTPFPDDVLTAFQAAKDRAEEPAAPDDGQITINHVYLRAMIDLYRTLHRHIEGQDT